MKQAFIEKFWGLVLKADDCWLWLGEKNEEGYGRLRVYNRETQKQDRIRAHRLSWEIFQGAIPDGLFVCHKCDNPSCVRGECKVSGCPHLRNTEGCESHLFLGTHDDNMQDMLMKGRGKVITAFGSNNPASKLDEDQVREIRARAAKGESNASLGRAFGVQKTTVSRIVRRLRWCHVS